MCAAALLQNRFRCYERLSLTADFTLDLVLVTEDSAELKAARIILGV